MSDAVISWTSEIINLNDKKIYFCYAIYDPDKPFVSLEEAIKTGKEPNPTSMFSEKNKLEEKDLPKGFKLLKKIGEVKNE